MPFWARTLPAERLPPPGGPPEGLRAPERPKTADFQRFRKNRRPTHTMRLETQLSHLRCSFHNARRPPTFQNEGFEPGLGLVPRLLGVWGSRGSGGCYWCIWCLLFVLIHAAIGHQ